MQTNFGSIWFTNKQFIINQSSQTPKTKKKF